MIQRPPGSNSTDTLFTYTTLFLSIPYVTGQALDHYGAVEAGKAADLVLLDRNPLKDIAATRATRAAVLRRQNRWKGPPMDDSEYFLAEAIALARANPDHCCRPFGAVVVKDGEVIARRGNEKLATGPPTPHPQPRHTPQ